LVKDEGATNINEMTPDQSHENKSEVNEEKLTFPNFIYVPSSIQEKRKQSESYETFSENKENKEK